MIRRTVFAIAIVAAVSVPLLAQNPAQDPPSISTQGEASFKLAPDVAWITLTAEARAPKPGEAQRKAAEAMTSVQAAVKAIGVAPNALKTSQYSLQPEMEYVNGSSRVKDYLARNSLEVRVDDIEKIGAVIDAAGASGAASVSGMRFDVKNRATVEREALAAAARDGLDRARAIASGLGQTIGAVIRVQDQRVYRNVESFVVNGGADRMAAQMPPTPIAPGDIEIKAQMILTVAIK